MSKAKAAKIIASLMTDTKQKPKGEFLAHYDKKLSPYGAHLLDAFQQWAPPVSDFWDEDKWSWYHQQPFLLILIISESTDTPPEWFWEYMELLVYITDDLLLPRVKQALAKMPQDALLTLINREWHRAKWDKSRCLSVLDLLDDDDAVKALLQEALVFTTNDYHYNNIEGHQSIRCYSSSRELMPYIVQSGEKTAHIMRGLWDAKLDDDAATLIALVLQEFPSADNAETLLQTLHNATKYGQRIAKEQLIKLGTAATDALTKGLKAKKKHIKTFCRQQLDQLESGNVYEPNAFEQLPWSERQELVLELRRQFALGDAKGENWSTFLTETASQTPERWLMASLQVFRENTQHQGMWKYLLNFLQHKAMETSSERLWFLYVHELSLINFNNNHTEFHLIKHIEAMPATIRRRVYSDAIKDSDGSLMVRIFEDYFRKGMCAPALLSQALLHSSKKVREAAISAAANYEGEDASPIVALLAERKKATRQSAARALAKLPQERLEPHQDALQGYLNNEKDDDTKALIAGIL